MDSCQHAYIRTVYIQVVLIKNSALSFDHREHVLAYMLGDLEALLGRDLGLPHLLHDLVLGVVPVGVCIGRSRYVTTS